MHGKTPPRAFSVGLFFFCLPDQGTQKKYEIIIHPATYKKEKKKKAEFSHPQIEKIIRSGFRTGCPFQKVAKLTKDVAARGRSHL